MFSFFRRWAAPRLRILQLCVVLVAFIHCTYSFACPDLPSRTTSTSLFGHDDDEVTLTRRHLLGALATIGMVAPAQPSLALKPRNEQLCGTGFFTNFLEYRCTEIGDISDEGQKTSLSASEAGAADSLMSKLNLDIEGGESTTKAEPATKSDNKSAESGPDASVDQSR